MSQGRIVVCNEHYSLTLVESNPDLLFVFGDNLESKGTGGQACIRYADNSFGIPTKVEPTMNEQRAFFRDELIELNALVFTACIGFIQDQIEKGKIIVFPSSGLGNGYAQMSKRAPKTWELFNKMLLEELGIVNTDTGLTKVRDLEVH